MVDAPADAEDIAVPEYEEDFDEAYIGPTLGLGSTWMSSTTMSMRRRRSTALLEGAPTLSNPELIANIESDYIQRQTMRSSRRSSGDRRRAITE